eukprot:scaffold4005_cov417-Prasinococcus_capsulatus_cf.AAC.1
MLKAFLLLLAWGRSSLPPAARTGRPCKDVLLLRPRRCPPLEVKLAPSRWDAGGLSTSCMWHPARGCNPGQPKHISPRSLPPGCCPNAAGPRGSSSSGGGGGGSGGSGGGGGGTRASASPSAPRIRPAAARGGGNSGAARGARDRRA